MTTEQDSFVFLTCVSDYSERWGCLSVSQILEVAVDRGQPAFGITDRGHLRCMPEFQKKTKDAEIKPIYGFRVALCRDHRKKGLDPAQREMVTKGIPLESQPTVLKQFAVDQGYTDKEGLGFLTLWAVTQEGLQNLYRLHTLAWVDAFYWQPRLDIELLEQYAEGIAVGSGGPDGPIAKLNRDGLFHEAEILCDNLHRIFGEHFYWEVQPHSMSKVRENNELGLEMQKRLGVKLLATVDPHFLDSDHHDAHRLAAANAVRGDSPWQDCGVGLDSFSFLDRSIVRWGLTKQGIPEELAHQACDETVRFAGKCEAQFIEQPFAQIVPDESLADDSLANQRLRERCEMYLEKHPNLDPARYRTRLEHELSRFEQLGMSRYMLYVAQDITDSCREKGIALGPGRGSSAGSLVAFCLGITTVDPIAFDLRFDRFLAPGRVNPPDIDIDVDAARRDEVVGLLEEKYGHTSVAKIGTLVRLKAKAALQTACRLAKVELSLSMAMSKDIDRCIDSSDLLTADVDDFVGMSDLCFKFNNQYPSVIKMAKQLQGQASAVGLHAGAIVCSPGPLMDFVPLESRAGENGERELVTCWDMEGIEQSGLLKIDLLVVAAIGKIDSGVQMVRQYEPAFDIDTIPLNDQATLDAFSKQQVAGVFQFDTPIGRKMLARVGKVENFMDLADLTSLGRPGPMESGQADMWIERAWNPETIKPSRHPKLDDITKSTRGVLIYQEQVMDVFAKLMGHPNPDEMRKLIGKSKGIGPILEKEPEWLEGCRKHTPDLSEEDAKLILAEVAMFGRYGFNKSHAVCYALNSYRMMYLKVHHPLAYYWASIRAEKDDKRKGLALAAQRSGIELLPPDISTSGLDFSVDQERRAIRGPLHQIKEVGEKAAARIVVTQPYDSFEDFMVRAKDRRVTSKVIVQLLKAGAFDELLDDPLLVVKHAEDLFARSKTKTKFKGWSEEIKALPNDNPSSKTERILARMEVDSMCLLDPFEAQVKRFEAQLVDFSDTEAFYEDHADGGVWVYGRIGNLRHRTVKTPEVNHSNTHESWGKPNAAFELQNTAGDRLNCRVEWNVLPDCKHALNDAGFVLCFGTPVPPQRDWPAKFVVRGMLPAESISRTVGPGAFWASILRRHHRIYDPRTIARFRSSRRSANQLSGLITDRRSILTKRGQEMAWIGVLTPNGFHEIIVFPQVYRRFADRLVARMVVSLSVEKTKDGDKWCFTGRSFDTP